MVKRLFLNYLQFFSCSSIINLGKKVITWVHKSVYAVFFLFAAFFSITGVLRRITNFNASEQTFFNNENVNKDSFSTHDTTSYIDSNIKINCSTTQKYASINSSLLWV